MCRWYICEVTDKTTITFIVWMLCQHVVSLRECNDVHEGERYGLSLAFTEIFSSRATTFTRWVLWPFWLKRQCLSLAHCSLMNKKHLVCLDSQWQFMTWQFLSGIFAFFDGQLKRKEKKKKEKQCSFLSGRRISKYSNYNCINLNLIQSEIWSLWCNAQNKSSEFPTLVLPLHILTPATEPPELIN